MSSNSDTTADATDRADPNIIDLLDLEPAEQAVLEALYQQFGQENVTTDLERIAQKAVEQRIYELRANREGVEIPDR